MWLTAPGTSVTPSVRSVTTRSSPSGRTSDGGEAVAAHGKAVGDVDGAASGRHLQLDGFADLDGRVGWADGKGKRGPSATGEDGEEESEAYDLFHEKG